MENEKTVKAQFFALYLYQNIVCSEYDKRPYPLNHIQKGTDEYLLLRTVDQLTDDEATDLAKIIIANPFTRYRKIEVVRDYKPTGFHYIAIKHKQVRFWLQIDCKLVNFTVYDMEDNVTMEIDMKPHVCVDFLRANGILLPFTYLDLNNIAQTIEPEELITKGWAKIDYPYTCNGCGKGLNEKDIAYQNTDQGDDYCTDCHQAIMSDPESAAGLKDDE